MKSFLIIAWRNVLRNRRRSGITILSIGFGLGAMLFIWGFIDGAHLQLKENFTGLFMGHLQIHVRGFEKTMAISQAIQNPASLQPVLQNHGEIKAFSKRVRSFAFFRTAQNSQGGLLVGIDPLQEAGVSKITKTIRQGRFLWPGASEAMVLGDLLAGNLKVKVGDQVLVMAQTANGTLKTDSFRIIGIIKTGTEELDRGLALVSLGDSQRLLDLNQAVTDVIVRVRNLSQLEGLEQSLRKELAHRDLEIMTWSELSPVLQQWIDFDEAFGYVFLLIVLVVVVAGILNTILMSLLERTHEFGIMLALGTKGYQLAFMAGMESLLLGLTGLVIGLVLGLLSVGIGSFTGIPLGAKIKEAMGSFYISDVVYPVMEWNHILSNALVVLMSCVLISLYPAWKISRTRPVSALHSP